MKKVTIAALLLGLYFVGIIYRIVLPDTVTRAPAPATQQAAPAARPAPAKAEPSLALAKAVPPAAPEAVRPARAEAPQPAKPAEQEVGDSTPLMLTPSGAVSPASRESPSGGPAEESGGGAGVSREAMNAPHGGSIENEIEYYIAEVHLKDRSRFLDRVDYFEQGLVPRQVAERDIERYARRWPSRNFELTPGSLRVRHEGGDHYTASFLYSYEVANRRHVKTGTGASTLELIAMGGQFFVAGIKETVNRDPD